MPLSIKPYLLVLILVSSVVFLYEEGHVLLSRPAVIEAPTETNYLHDNSIREFRNNSNINNNDEIDGNGSDKRLQRLNEACVAFNEVPKNKLPWGKEHRLDSYVYDGSHQLAYCHFPKVASTWWMEVLARSQDMPKTEVDGFIANSTIHGFMLKRSVRSSKLNEDVFRFVFVREPVGRLISAFKNKFVGKHQEQPIVSTLKGFLRNHGRPLNITFSSMIDLVIDEAKYGRVSYGSLHWMPYYTMCNLCQTRLDFIGTMETMVDDVDFIVSQFPHLSNYTDVHQRENSASTAQSRASSAKIKQNLLSELSDQQRQDLCNIYDWDFRMFGYDNLFCL